VTDVIPRLARRRFWLFLLAFYAAWILRVVLLMPVSAGMENEWLRMAWSHSLRVVLWIVPALVYLAYVERVRPLAFLKVTPFPRGRRLLWGAGLIVGFFMVSPVISFLFMGASFDKLWTMTGVSWAQLVIGMVFIAVAEELLFRGFVLQHLRLWHPFQRANLITALLFLLIHWPGWLYMQGAHWGLVQQSVSVFVLGWLFGLLMEKTQSLWPPVALHFLNNIFAATTLP